MKKYERPTTEVLHLHLESILTQSTGLPDDFDDYGEVSGNLPGGQDWD